MQESGMDVWFWTLEGCGKRWEDGFEWCKCELKDVDQLVPVKLLDGYCYWCVARVRVSDRIGIVQVLAVQGKEKCPWKLNGGDATRGDFKLV